MSEIPGPARVLETTRGALRFPAFLPDATRGVVRGVDASDLKECGVEAFMVNSLHLASRPGSTVLKQAGGVHSYLGWERPIASDSGGFQLYSLIRSSTNLGSIGADGFTYRPDRKSPWRKLTAESCIHRQLRMGADILFCLDHCTHPDAPEAEQRQSVENTVRWAEKGKAAFERARGGAKAKIGPRPADPLLFAVVQGGSDPSLRKECAERLLEIGFDGYGYGGWPVDDDGRLVEAVFSTAELIPGRFPLHGLGIGNPESLRDAFSAGYDLFDCVLPTRDARHRRLYVFSDSTGMISAEGRGWYGNLYIGDERYRRDFKPPDPGCDCLCCRRYSRSYLHHLFQVGDCLAHRLATIHNLRFYSRMIERLRESKSLRRAVR